MARLLAGTLCVLALAGCGGAAEEATPSVAAPAQTEAPPTEPEPEPEPAPEPLPGLPAQLAGYESWTRVNDEPIAPRDADPHLGTKNVYESVAAVDGVYPPGAIVVKEATRPDADFIGLVAMMRKEPGANPEHNDWVFVEWTRDSPDAAFSELASGGVCTSCHMGARETDYVFTR